MSQDGWDARNAATQVLSGLYEAIADYSQYESLFAAWDEFVDSNPADVLSSTADWQSFFRDHFSRVGDYIARADLDDRESPLNYVERQIVPSATFNEAGRLVAANEQFKALLAPESAETLRLLDHLALPADKRRFRKLFERSNAMVPALLSLGLPGTSERVFAVATQVDLLDTLPGKASKLVAIRIAKPSWNDSLSRLLASAYELTPAELEILEGLIQSGNLQQVATSRQRSIRTVRTQLNSIYAKLGISGQTELALFMATLAHLISEPASSSSLPPTVERGGAAIRKYIHLHENGRETAFLEYGPSTGLPVLMLHTTTPPEMTSEFRQLCANRGLRIIAPYKPGSGGTTARPASDGPTELTRDFVDILDRLKISRAIVSGHCSGGLYALEFAKRFPDRTSAILLMDTGVPFRSRRELMALPRSVRRTFVPARYFPEVLNVPHRIIAGNFRKSQSGEARVVDYFFEDSPADRSLTRTDRKYYEITRDIIAYSFEDIDRLVGDVCRWASDWSPLLEHVCERHELTFLHGAENAMFKVDPILEFAERHKSASAHIVENVGQLLAYTHPQSFIECIDRQEPIHLSENG